VANGITTILPVHLSKPGTTEKTYLLRAVQSVLSQECPLPMELLVIDDGSEPEIRLPANPQVRLVKLPRNYGITYALNAGLTQARYDLIARIDADDQWAPGKLLKQVAMMEADPDLTLVASGMRLVHPGNSHLDRDELRGGDWAHVLELSNKIGCPFPHGSILGRKEIFLKLGGYPQAAECQHGEDFALWAQWIRFFKVAICDEVFLRYWVTEGQISMRFAAEQQSASEAARRTLGKPGDVSEAVQKIARTLGLGLTDTSLALFAAWRYFEYILVDDDIYQAVSTVLPDRAVHRLEGADKLLAKRFFHLTKQKRTAPHPGHSR
jgi:hypothetical protein